MSKTFFFVFPFFILVTAQFVFSIFKVLHAPAQDFEVFYLSGKQFLLSQNPYLLLGKDIVRNPPPALFLFGLFSFAPLIASQAAWAIFSLGTFFYSSLYFQKIIGKVSLVQTLGFLSLVFLFFPFRYNLGSGQVNNLLLMLLTLTFYFLWKKENWKAGILLALAISLKFTPLFLLLPLLLRKQIKPLITTIVSLISLALFTFLFKGGSVFTQYQKVSSSFFDFHISSYYNQSLTGLLARLQLSPQLSQQILYVSLFLFLIIFGIFCYKLKKRGLAGELIIWNSSILTMLIFAPFAWQYHFVITIFPLVTTFYLISKTKIYNKVFLFLTLGASYLLLALNIQSLSFSHIYLSAIVLSNQLWGSILLLVLNIYLGSRVLKINFTR